MISQILMAPNQPFGSARATTKQAVSSHPAPTYSTGALLPNRHATDYLGDKIITTVRPSNLGPCSTSATSWVYCGDLVEQFPTQLRERYLTASKHHGNLDLVLLFQKTV